MPTPEQLNESKAQLRRFLSVYAAGVERWVVEVRALNVPRKWGSPITRAGFFDLPKARRELWQAVESLLTNEAGQPEGVFVTLNPLLPDMLARANNRLLDLVGRKDVSATDKHVLRRHHLLIDVDPVRPAAGICATDAEKAAARLVIDGVREDMRTRLGFGEPVLVIDSGNGFHHWYQIDLPADDGGRVEKVIKHLAARHNTAAATLDTSVFNASRITKAPGTWNRKGESVPELGRVHRPVVILETPCERTSSPPS